MRHKPSPLTRLFLTTTVLAFLAAPSVGQDDAADRRAQPKPLSEIIRNVEAMNLGAITSAELDDGLWEVEIDTKDGELTVYVDPATAKERRRSRDDDDDDNEAPPADAKKLSEVLAAIEKEGNVRVTDVEFDDGHWEITLREGDRRREYQYDPKTGERRTR